MAYSTVKMVRQALVPSSDGSVPDPVSNTAADLSDAQLQDAIAEADSTIDGYIGRYYAVPVQAKITGDDTDGTVGAIPHPIDYWSRNIAAYNATLTFRGSQDFEDNDPVARRYTATINALVAVSKGQVGLQLPDNTSTNSATAAGAPFNPYVGDLFDPCDFNLRPLNPAWPVVPAFGGWSGERW